MRFLRICLALILVGWWAPYIFVAGARIGAAVHRRTLLRTGCRRCADGRAAYTTSRWGGHFRRRSIEAPLDRLFGGAP